MKNNIKEIRAFLSENKEKILILNQVRDEIGAFYLYVIKYFSKSYNINLSLEHEIINKNETNDLFETNIIKVFALTSKIKIEVVIESNNNSIIFTDYKNYKKYQSKHKCINGYDYILDIEYFVKDILNIHDTGLVNSIKQNPQFIYSETSKYLINNKGYLSDKSSHQITNFVLEIRKFIFNSKNKTDIKKIFLKIKQEAHYKKFNFLTY